MKITTLESAPAASPISAPPDFERPAAAGDGPSTFDRVLRRLSGELDRGEGAMRSATRALGTSSQWSPGDLIALQAGVYRYSEVIDVASRFVDRATSSVKTVLQGSAQ